MPIAVYNRFRKRQYEGVSRLIACILTAALIGGGTGSAWSQPGPEPVRHTLTFPEAVHNYLEVESVFPVESEGPLDIFMAVWIPGFYKVLDFARSVELVRATTSSGDPLDVEKVDTNRWRVQADGPGSVTVTYRVYANKPMSFGNWVTSDFAAINGAPTFMCPVGDLQLGDGRPQMVRLVLPDGWSRTVSGLPVFEGEENHYVAKSFDELVDSPILAGNPTVYEFEVAGKAHVVANEGEDGLWEGDIDDIETIVEAVYRFWGQLPYDRYAFLNVFSDRHGGGLEHLSSTLIISNRWTSGRPDDYRRWLSVACHELFHTWNVKHLRPVELGPFDYEQAVPTGGLWIAEGLSAYYDDLLLCRAGLITREQYLETVSQDVERMQTTPGRKVRGLEQSSFDSWLAFGFFDDNTMNSTVDYYAKGAVAGFLIDARIRKETGDERSLDDVMRLAYERYSGERGYTTDEFRDVISEVAGTDLSTWLGDLTKSTEEYRYDDALDYYGLRFKSPNGQGNSEGETSAKEAWLGLQTRDDGGRLVVSGVPRDTPAWKYGFTVDDEIIALDDFRVPAHGWGKRLKHYRPGTEATVLVARHGRMLGIPVVFAEEPNQSWDIETAPKPTRQQKQHIDSWLGVR